MKAKAIGTLVFYLILITINIIFDYLADFIYNEERILLDLTFPLLPSLIYMISVFINTKRRPIILISIYILILFVLFIIGGGVFTLNVFVTKLSILPGLIFDNVYLDLKYKATASIIAVLVLYTTASLTDILINKLRNN